MAAELLRLVRIDRRVADAQAERGDFLGIGGPHIDVQLVNLGRFFIAPAVCAQVDGGVADDAAHGFLVAQDLQAATARSGGVGAANAINAQEALFGDLFDDEADFVGVGFEHDPLGSALRGPCFQSGPDGAVSVIFHAVGMGADVSGPFALARKLKSGGAGGV